MKVVWTELAADKWEQIATYIFTEFGFEAVEEYREETQQYEDAILTNPQIGAIEPLLYNRSYEYRSVVVHRKTKMVYYVDGETIVIANVWDTRQEPMNQSAKTR